MSAQVLDERKGNGHYAGGAKGSDVGLLDSQEVVEEASDGMGGEFFMGPNRKTTKYQVQRIYFLPENIWKEYEDVHPPVHHHLPGAPEAGGQLHVGNITEDGFVMIFIPDNQLGLAAGWTTGLSLFLTGVSCFSSESVDMTNTSEQASILSSEVDLDLVCAPALHMFITDAHGSVEILGTVPPEIKKQLHIGHHPHNHDLLPGLPLDAELGLHQVYVRHNHKLIVDQRNNVGIERFLGTGAGHRAQLDTSDATEDEADVAVGVSLQGDDLANCALQAYCGSAVQVCCLLVARLWSHLCYSHFSRLTRRKQAGYSWTRLR